MNAVKNNPYRTLGLFGNSTERKLLKQITDLKRFAEIGKTMTFDYDFPFFGEVVRSTEKVQEAASKIEQAKNKVHHALFWFLNSGHIDEAALNNLKDGHIEKATEIWEKTLKDSTVTVKNFAAISNLSTLQLGIVTYNGSFDPEKFAACIDMKGKLIMSDAWDIYISTIIGDDLSVDREELLKDFVDEVIQITKPYLTNSTQKTGLLSGVMDTGIGLYRWNTGDLYFGEWKNGNRSGFGVYLWESGHYFRGHFDSNTLDGEGVYLFPNGAKRIGEWQNNVYQANKHYDSEAIEKKIRNKNIELKKQSNIEFNPITIVQLINSFRSFPNEIRQYVSGNFTNRPLNDIESKIELTKQKRKALPIAADKHGEDLFNTTKRDLSFLKNIWNTTNVQYQLILNKLANELLQCSIDFYNYWNNKEPDFDPYDKTQKIALSAKSIEPTGQVKTRLNEALETLQGIRQREIDDVLNFLKNANDVYDKVRKENHKNLILLAYSRKVVNEDKLMESARILLRNSSVIKIAKLNDHKVINDFYDALEKLIRFVSTESSGFFIKQKDYFINGLPDTSPLKRKIAISKLKKEIENLQIKLSGIREKRYYASEIELIKNELTQIKAWKLFRLKEKRELELNEQQDKLNLLYIKGETEKKEEIIKLEEQLVIKRRELKYLNI